MLFQKLISTATNLQLSFGSGATSTVTQNSTTFTGVAIGSAFITRS